MSLSRLSCDDREQIRRSQIAMTVSNLGCVTRLASDGSRPTATANGKEANGRTIVSVVSVALARKPRPRAQRGKADFCAVEQAC